MKWEGVVGKGGGRDIEETIPLFYKNPLQLSPAARVEELCEGPGLPSPSLISLMVSVDVKQHLKMKSGCP